MSDMRFVLIGVGMIFAGFGVLGVFGGQYQAATLEADEFGTCFEYSDTSPPLEIECSYKVLDQTVFFALVIGLIGAGVISLVKGARGDWDNRIKPEDVVGPGRRND